MSDLEKFRAEQLQDPEFRSYFLDMQPEADIAKSLVAVRLKLGLTQKDLADLTGISQANISRLESCEGSPSLKTLKRLAKGLNHRLKIEFVPLEAE